MKTTTFKKPTKVQVKKSKNFFTVNVRNRRIALKMSQAKLASLAGVDRKTINRIENGHFHPNVDTVVRLMIVLNLQPAKLFKLYA